MQREEDREDEKDSMSAHAVSNRRRSFEQPLQAKLHCRVTATNRSTNARANERTRFKEE
jgi:hypothetical protein